MHEKKDIKEEKICSAIKHINSRIEFLENNHEQGKYLMIYELTAIKKILIAKND